MKNLVNISKLFTKNNGGNKFEISDVASFKEALYKEMEYCKEINIGQYIFNDFVDFIKKKI